MGDDVMKRVFSNYTVLYDFVIIQLFASITTLNDRHQYLCSLCNGKARSCCSIQIGREYLAVFTFVKLGCFVKQTKIFLFIYYAKFR